MSKMINLVEDMRARLEAIADAEQALVHALGEALNRVDQKLLQDVRTITSEHEARRGVILSELQSLASSIGVLPAPREVVAEIAYEPAVEAIASANDPEPVFANDAEPEFANEPEPAFGRGDWREAANNIQQELDIFARRRASSH